MALYPPLRPRSAPSLVTTLLLLVCSSAAVSAQATPAGCWLGAMGAGANQTRTILEVRRAGSEWTGAIHRMNGALSSAEAEVRVTADSLWFTFPSSLGAGSAVFTATVRGDSLAGMTTSAGGLYPSSFRRIDPSTTDPAQELIGYWAGGLYQGDVLAARLGLEFAPAPCGQVAATLDSPDEGAEDVPIATFALSGDSLTLAVPRAQVSVEAVVSPARDSLAGTWTQGPATVWIRMRRGDGVASFLRPQDPSPPFPYEVLDAEYVNDRDGTEFAGTLTIPPGDGPFPAALLVTGSGAQDRNESVMGHRPFLIIADHLTRRGIAVLRVDDRGVGGSGGSQTEATIDDNVGDALAAVAFLRGRPEIDPERIGLIGHSEGGYVGPAAAAASDDVAFVVMLAGPAITGRQILIDQSRAIMEAAGVPKVEIDAELATSTAVLDIASTVADAEEMRARVLAAVTARLEEMPPEARAEYVRASGGEARLRSQLEARVELMSTPWFLHLIAFDPVPHLEAMDVPVLALFGDRDLQVPVEPSASILREVWADHPDATVHVFPELNHLFQHAETGMLAEYAVIEETFAPEALDMMADWIGERFGEGP